MYLLYVKGRGYFDGYAKKTVKYNFGERINNVRIDTEYFKYRIKFRRDPDTVKNAFMFYDKQNATKMIDEISKVIANGTTCDDKVNSYRTYRSFLNIDELTKVDGKFTIVKQEVGVKKRTIRLDSKKYTSVRKHNDIRGNGNTNCDFCKTTFINDEPILLLGSMYYICKNCLDGIHADMTSQYNANPKHKDITDAWNLEMVAREL